MIDVQLTPECSEGMLLTKITHDQVTTTINKRHRGLIDQWKTRVIAAHWFSENDLLLVDSTISKKTQTPVSSEQVRILIVQVTAYLAIKLHPKLPSGTIERSMNMEQILAIVAESFGEKVICHFDEPPSTLYVGPWDGQTPRISTNESHLLMGSFSPDKHFCALVWAFDLGRYRKWLTTV